MSTKSQRAKKQAQRRHHQQQVAGRSSTVQSVLPDLNTARSLSAGSEAKSADDFFAEHFKFISVDVPPSKDPGYGSDEHLAFEENRRVEDWTDTRRSDLNGTSLVELRTNYVSACKIKGGWSLKKPDLIEAIIAWELENPPEPHEEH